jgi:hypothetical protein
LLDDDAVGSEGLEDRSWVMDISEIVAKAYDISTYLQYMQRMLCINMAKILIVYHSQSGNTEMLARSVEQGVV